MNIQVSYVNELIGFFHFIFRIRNGLNYQLKQTYFWTALKLTLPTSLTSLSQRWDRDLKARTTAGDWISRVHSVIIDVSNFNRSAPCLCGLEQKQRQWQWYWITCHHTSLVSDTLCDKKSTTITQLIRWQTMYTNRLYKNILIRYTTCKLNCVFYPQTLKPMQTEIEQYAELYILPLGSTNLQGSWMQKVR